MVLPFPGSAGAYYAGNIASGNAGTGATWDWCYLGLVLLGMLLVLKQEGIPSLSGPIPSGASNIRDHSISS